VAATTSVVLLAFLVPLGLLLRSEAEQQAIATATLRAQALAAVVALDPDQAAGRWWSAAGRRRRAGLAGGPARRAGRQRRRLHRARAGLADRTARAAGGTLHRSRAPLGGARVELTFAPPA
jgi:hypothetical protein